MSILKLLNTHQALLSGILNNQLQFSKEANSESNVIIRKVYEIECNFYVSFENDTLPINRYTDLSCIQMKLVNTYTPYIELVSKP